ncbi:MAG TPA: DUF3185 domain-containing protein [Phycisphaerae bacterium]|nr:DUF3185 domain-containing protein [Phycisphaerae bacterium]
MNLRIIIAVALIALGVVGLAYQGFTYTTRERVVDVGPVHADVDKTHTVPITPIVGGLALVSGILLLVVNRKSTQ